MNTAEAGRRVEVVLIESPTVPVIGVGEGTLPTMVAILREIGIDERDFFRECNASFKFGVRFEGWNLNERGTPYSFTHPFGAMAQRVIDQPQRPRILKLFWSPSTSVHSPQA